MIDVATLKANTPLAPTIESLTGQPIVQHKISAPWRQENTPSVHVYDDGSWWDYGAGVGGDVIDFLGYYYYGLQYNPETHFTEVVDRIGSLGIKPLPTDTQRTKSTPKPPKRNVVSLEQIMDWHERMPAQRRAYWHSRGLLDRTIDEFFLGWDGRRYTIPALYRLQPFGVKRRQSEIDDGIPAKYNQIAGSRAGLFNADCLWTATRCIICEGEIDAMLLSQAGYHVVSSTAGAGSWKEGWAELFSHIPEIVILYDNDEAGREGACRVRASLRRAEIVTLPASIKDVGELWKTGSCTAWLAENL